MIAVAMTMALSIEAQALTNQEVVNKALPSVVAIVLSNANTNAQFEGTGWFVTENRIVTNNHVISKHEYTGIQIINVATGQKFTIDHVSYNNVSTDVAVLTVRESNTTHLNLSTLSPVRDLGVVIIGNPDEQYGKVTYGKLGETVNNIPDKHYSGTKIWANIIGGNSGSPVLDSNGDVIGMIWGAPDDEQSGIAVNIQTLKLAQLDTVDLNITGLAQTTPVPTPNPSSIESQDKPTVNEYAGLKVPTKFGATRQGNYHTLTEVTDADAFVAIAAPVVAYVVGSNQGRDCSALFYQQLNKYYDEKNVPYSRVFQADTAYHKKHPNRTFSVDARNVWVEKINWQGNTTFLVTVPTKWADGKAGRFECDSGQRSARDP